MPTDETAEILEERNRRTAGRHALRTGRCGDNKNLESGKLPPERRNDCTMGAGLFFPLN